MRHPGDTAIGGYFAMEAGHAGGVPPYPDDFVGFQSARAALAAVMVASGVTRAWVPHFICGAVPDALRWAGVGMLGYPLDGSLGVPAATPVADGDWVVCVDYFGLHADACDEAIARYGAHRVVVDASQALFHSARPGATTIYSPRKFVGVPDGGLLVSPHAVGDRLPADEPGSQWRSRHLATRASGDVATGYRQFQEAEASLDDCRPASLSASTRKALGNVDWQVVRRRRIANYATLAESLPGTPLLQPSLREGAVPMCCPVRVPDAPALRAVLASKGIFTASYWPGVHLPPDDTAGHRLRDQTIYLPCDQRYGQKDMRDVARTLSLHLGTP